MKEHQAPYDIVIMIVKGNIDFAVNGDMHKLKKGDMFHLDAKVPHSLGNAP